MSELSDGTVVPHFLGVATGPGKDAFELNMSNATLRVGRVIQIHYPDDATNGNKRYTEYDVEVDQADSSVHTRLIYPRVLVGALFANVADYERYTPRRSKPKKIGDTLDTGSWVVLACVNGNSRQALIIGGWPHPDAPKDLGEDGGHHYIREFNGVRHEINKDGELTISFRGATGDDGKLADGADDKASGSTITLAKDGSIEIKTAKGNQSVKLNHKDKTIEIVSDSKLSIKSNGDVVIESTGVKAGGANLTEKWVKGSTYRQQEETMHNQIMGALQTLTTMIASAGAALTSAGGSPIVAGPSLAPAGAALTSAGPIFAQIMTAIQTFETQSETYLSSKNFTD